MEKMRTIILFVFISLVIVSSLYFLYTYYPGFHPLSQTDFRLTRNEIIQYAGQFLPLEVNVNELSSEANYVINDESFFLKRNITEENYEESFLKYYRYWEILFHPKAERISSYRLGNNESTKVQSSTDNLYKIWLSADGQLLLLCDFQGPVLRALKDTMSVRDFRPAPGNLPNFQVRQFGMTARQTALNFLVDYVRDTTDLEIVERSVESDSTVRYFNFVFKEIRNDVQIYHTIRNTQGKVFYYKCSLHLGNFDKKLSQFEETSKLIFEIWEVVIYLFLIILLIFFLFRLLRQETFSFKIAIPIAICIFVLQLMTSMVELWSSSVLLIMLGALVWAASYFIGILFLYSIGDAFTRQVWSSRLHVNDLFHQSKFFRPVSGKAILRGIFLGCISLCVYVVILYCYQNLFAGEVIIKDDLEYKTSTLFPTLIVTITLLVNSVFHEYFFRLFGLSVLKKWFKKNSWIILLGASAGLFFSTDFDILNLPVKIISFFIPAVIFVVFFIRFEILTTVVGYFSFTMFSKAIIFSHSGEKYFQELGIGLHFVLGILLILGLVSILFGKKDDEEEDIYVPEYMARQTEKTRLLRELDLARSIQLQFLPKTTPNIQGYQIAAECLPAWEVGGDYFDFFEMNNGKLGIVIGDVSNKGISAAFFMTLVKGFLKVLSEQYQKPCDILRQVNKLFYANVERGNFVSMIYGILDPKNNIFTFGRAGHNPLLLVIGESDRIEWKTPPGLAIGLVGDEKFAPLLVEEHIKIELGDSIILYTDGYPEAMNSKLHEFGEKNLQEIIKTNQNNSAHTIIKKLDTAVSNWEGKQRALDDKTIVVIKRG